MRKRLLFLFCLLAGLAFRSPGAEEKPKPAPVSLDPIFAAASPWETTVDDFVKQNPDAGFRWISAAHDAAQSNRKELLLFNLPVNQAVVQFSGGKASGVSVLFYNRGDAGEIPQDQFEALEARCEKTLSDLTKSAPTARGRDPRNAVKAPGLVWKTAQSEFLLEFSITKTASVPFRAEFIRLTVTPPEKQKSLLEASQSASLTATKFNGPAHVKKDPSGDVWIDGIPMVDQGEKGYCVVATAERVMRYYGVRVDEHELAQIANTSDKGTSSDAMFEALQKLCNRLRVKTRPVVDFNNKRLNTLITDYNHAAQKGHRADEINPNVKSLTEIYQQMDSDLLRETLTKNPAEMDRVFRLFQRHIDSGIPVVWSVMIGVLPQPQDPKGFGGHTRLIIGYNAQSRELIYSDSWGMGHEKKRMPLADAWTMTLGANTIEPL
jgi:hypothetical protein